MDGWTEPTPSPTAAKSVRPFPLGFADGRTGPPGENPADLWREWVAQAPPLRPSIHPNPLGKLDGWTDRTDEWPASRSARIAPGGESASHARRMIRGTMVRGWWTPPTDASGEAALGLLRSFAAFGGRAISGLHSFVQVRHPTFRSGCAGRCGAPAPALQYPATPKAAKHRSSPRAAGPRL